MRALLAILRKDLRLLARDPAGLFFTVVFPPLTAIFFGTIFSRDDGGEAISVVLVDEDGSAESRAFLARLDAAPELATRRGERAAAVAAVRKGKETAYVLVPSGFGDARRRLLFGGTARVVIGVDPSRRAEAGLLRGVVTRYLYEGVQDLFADPDEGRDLVRRARSDLAASGDTSQWARDVSRFLAEVDRFLAAIPDASDGAGDTAGSRPRWQPVDVAVEAVTRARAGPTSYFEISFPQAILWGLMMCAMSFAMTLVSERQQGTFLRLRVAPVTRTQIVGGKAAACLIVIGVVEVGLLALGRVAFGLRVTPSVVLLLALVASAVCFVGIMMLLATIGRTARAASGYATAAMLVLMMLGGGMVPVMFMPGWMRAIAVVSPVRWALLAIEGATWRGFSLSEMLLPCGVLVATGVVAFVAGVRLLRDD